ncbi:TldD/PmbA family protein [bacterium]|nr:TldD/PmbA family protein [bacterium]
MREVIEEALAAARRAGAMFADLRYSEGAGTTVLVQDGRADKIGAGRARGAGVRVLVDGAWGFAPTNNPTRDELQRCAEDAVRMARAAAPAVTDPGMVAEVEPVQARVVGEMATDPRGVPLGERVKRLHALERVAASRDGIVNSVVQYADAVGRSIVANSFGTYLESEGARCQVGVRVTASDGAERQSTGKGRASRGGFELIERLDPEAFAGATADRAVALLSAQQAPAGKFNVIIDPLICGLLVHEAFGHNSEADAVWTGNSILAGKLGQPVAADGVTIVDDPTLPGLNGSFEYDHEGVPARRHVIVDRGVLVGYLHSLETAARMGMEPNGAARAQGHQDVPIVRMSNTAIEPGDCGFDEMLAQVGDGLYLSGGAWGYVYTAAGQFTCNVEQAFRIERGELTTRYRNVCISGMTLETLGNVIAVGRDVKFELGGTCGKEGQAAPVDSGGPHVAIAGVVVGGQGEL